MALGQQQRQDPAAPLFAVDTDITPLQSKYFEYAEKAFKDPDELSRAYSSIVNTFGSIQQARDIQNERMQKDEDRAIQNQLRNTQLDASRFELAQARDKVREKQQSLAQTSGFLQGINQIKAQFAGDPAAAYSAINDFGAQNASAFENPTNKNAFELTLNSLRTPAELRLDKDKGLDAGTISNLSKLTSAQQEAMFPGSSRNPYVVAASAANQLDLESKGETKAQRDQKAAVEKVERSNVALRNKVNQYLTPLEGLTKVDPVSSYQPSEFNLIDQTLTGLQQLDLIDETDKNNLKDVGIYALETEKKPADSKKRLLNKFGFGTATDRSTVDEPTQLRNLAEQQQRILKATVANAKIKASKKGFNLDESESVPASSPQGFNPVRTTGRPAQ